VFISIVSITICIISISSSSLCSLASFLLLLEFESTLCEKEGGGEDCYEEGYVVGGEAELHAGDRLGVRGVRGVGKITFCVCFS
jgi:hypothetical protein